MAFIGNTNTTQAFTPAVDYFSGNGSTTAFTLSRPVASVAQVEAVIDNVVQNPSSAYTVSSNTITFTSAPLSGTNNIYVRYTSPITQVIAPGQGTVGITQLTATGTPSSSTYLRGDNTWSAVSGGVTSAVAGTGISVSGATGAVTFTNTGVTSLTTSSGLSTNTSATGAVSVTNTGVTSIVAGTGISISGATGAVTVTNSSTVASATIAKAWVNFDGTSSTIRSSYNVGSITKTATGIFVINFSTALSNANYSLLASVSPNFGVAGAVATVYDNNSSYTATTTAAYILTRNQITQSPMDVVGVAIAVFGS